MSANAQLSEHIAASKGAANHEFDLGKDCRASGCLYHVALESESSQRSAVHENRIRFGREIQTKNAEPVNHLSVLLIKAVKRFSRSY
ncbi:hypothetical protein [Methylomonas koyamae]|uniref:hypothetical protein n=1 Tax=Methylomonas koyamae TaxID=702114 RepID=UPI0028731DBE|nr:hypothetical protein [Methylomonas koyamae]WNB78028.1 hypothetical protein RI210_10690 [Methylomonas koyamae]